MMGAQRRPVLCAMSLAVAAWALACGRYGPPIRAVSADSADSADSASGASGASGASETFARPPDTRHGRSEEAVPYMLEGLERQSAFDGDGDRESVFESAGEPEKTSEKTSEEASAETTEPAIERSDEPSAAPSGRGSATP